MIRIIELVSLNYEDVCKPNLDSDSNISLKQCANLYRNMYGKPFAFNNFFERS